MIERFGIAVVGIVFAANASAADSLLAQCEKLKRKADRSECIAAAVRAMAPAVQAPPPQQKEDPAAKAKTVLSAAQAIESVTSSGVSYADYSQYIQRLAIAIDEYRGIAQAKPRRPQWLT